MPRWLTPLECAHRERSKQLVASGQRCAELEMTAKQLQEALAQAMCSLRPEALDRLGGVPPA